MRYRALSQTGDYQFGMGRTEFLVNSPAAVGQLIVTRLRLLRGEWFLDVSEGTPYGDQVLGTNTASTRDAAIRGRILQTQGVTGIASYQSSVDAETRVFSVAATVDTIYGRVAVKGDDNFTDDSFTWDVFTWDVGKRWGI